MGLKSPFQFGKIAEGRFFTNRKQDIDRLLVNFSSNLNTILISPRRWGKTSLVKKTAQLAGKKFSDYRFVYIDMFYLRSENEFYNYFTREVLKSTSGKLEEWIQTAKSFLGKISPKISVGVDPLNDFEISFELRDVERHFIDILNLPEKIAKEKNIKIIICIDEFQNLSKIADPRGFQQRLRAAWQHHQKTVYCLYGSKRSILMNIFENQSNPLYKFGEVLYLEKIKDTDLQKFIIARFKFTGKFIDDEQALKIVELMQNHPYYVQQLAHLVWVQAEDIVNEKNMDQAIQDLLDQNSLLFEREIEHLSNTQINFLKALADGISDGISSKEIINQYNLGTSGNVIKVKKTLLAREIIDIIQSQPVFMDPAFQLWFKEYYHK
ncbi:ATP-binding protein [Calditrichota bacterium]